MALGLLAYLRFEDAWGGCQEGLTTWEMGQEPQGGQVPGLSLNVLISVYELLQVM